MNASEAVFDAFAELDPLEVWESRADDLEVIECPLLGSAFFDKNVKEERKDDDDEEAKNDSSPEGFEDGLGDLSSGAGEDGGGEDEEEGEDGGEFHGKCVGNDAR